MNSKHLGTRLLLGISLLGPGLLATPVAAQVTVQVGIPLPPPIVFAAPPVVVVLPGFDIYCPGHRRGGLFRRWILVAAVAGPLVSLPVLRPRLELVLERSVFLRKRAPGLAKRLQGPSMGRPAVGLRARVPRSRGTELELVEIDQLLEEAEELGSARQEGRL
jgi:hypothetical protein